MNRRQLIQSIMGGSAVTAVQVVAKDNPAERETERRHWLRDGSGKWWLIEWTGWKGAQGSEILAGQHLAYPVSGRFSVDVDAQWPNVYASYPGVCGVFERGDLFNICMQWEQIKTHGIPTVFTNPEKLKSLEIVNYYRLLGHIAKVERVDWGKFPHLSYERRRMIEEA